MLEGINILSEYTEPLVTFGRLVAAYGLAVFGILCIIGFITTLLERDGSLGFFTSGILCIFLSILCFCTYYSLKDEPPAQYYKVLISEDVNFIDLDELYEVVKKDGEIYTIKVK